MADWNTILGQWFGSIGLTPDQGLGLLFFIALVVVLYFGFKNTKK